MKGQKAECMPSLWSLTCLKRVRSYAWMVDLLSDVSGMHSSLGKVCISKLKPGIKISTCLCRHTTAMQTHLSQAGLKCNTNDVWGIEADTKICLQHWFRSNMNDVWGKTLVSSLMPQTYFILPINACLLHHCPQSRLTPVLASCAGMHFALSRPQRKFSFFACL